MGKKLGSFDALMLLVTGVLFADSIASNAAAGAPSLTWWVILGIFYMLPMGAIIGELSQAYPSEGGIYVWTTQGLGPKWGALSGWLSFFCGLFIPTSCFIMVSDIFFNLFFPGGSMMERILLAIVLVWVLGFVTSLPMSESQWITNIAGVIKIILYVACLACGIAYVASGHAPANDFNLQTLMPTPSQSLTFLPVILYCCTGTELASASAEQMDEPGRMLPRIVLLMAVLNVVFNIIASLGLLLVMPPDVIAEDLNMALLNEFSCVIGHGVPYYLFVIAFLFSLFVQTATWVIGGDRGACESAKAGDLPAFLGYEKNDQPVGAILTVCAFSTVLLLVYGIFASTASELFFSLLSCGVLATLLPYVFMIASYHRLKWAERLPQEGFHCPGGYGLSWLIQIIQCATLLILIYVPGYGFNDAVVTNVLGAALMVGTGFLVISSKMRRKQTLEMRENEGNGRGPLKG